MGQTSTLETGTLSLIHFELLYNEIPRNSGGIGAREKNTKLKFSFCGPIQTRWDQSGRPMMPAKELPEWHREPWT